MRFDSPCCAVMVAQQGLAVGLLQLRNRGEKRRTGLLAATTRSRAHRAVIMHVSVLLALFGTCLARNAAGFQHRARELHIALSVTRQHAGSGGADVGTVKVEAYALREVGDHALGKTRVGTRRTTLRTLQARTYALGEERLVYSELARVRIQHLIDDSHQGLPIAMRRRRNG